MGRTDYYDDPNAPMANSLVVAVVAVVLDDDGRVLMIERTDNGKWALPGGAQELGESVRDAAVRETREETGIDVEVSGVVGIYSDPKHVIAYDDGEVRQEFSICLSARAVGGTPTSSDESRSVRWVDPSALYSMAIDPRMRQRIDDGLSGQAPHVD
ncbi:NUDIX domain-containing protein [Actinomycetospora endophytica]|uniref:NUDIX domain-containing protein n=1 Tax=Actinomycetospora endophytica TaxID=2291215 RepID=A0ABS8PJT7_9PSEU|nr:NUDIX domain-containing protein [Actinomycetospora endophytica]MCD2197681.1 NUDIX domain-containing protein [Actinomycetospora endophytica]